VAVILPLISMTQDVVILNQAEQNTVGEEKKKSVRGIMICCR